MASRTAEQVILDARGDPLSKLFAHWLIKEYRRTIANPQEEDVQVIHVGTATVGRHVGPRENGPLWLGGQVGGR